MQNITYTTLILSFGYNIFIFCYVGEILAEEVWFYPDLRMRLYINIRIYILQCKKVAEETYMIDWYQLKGRNVLSLLLIIAMSSSSNRLTAGKFVELSISSFGDVRIITHSLLLLQNFRRKTTRNACITDGKDVVCVFEYASYGDFLKELHT